MSSGTVIPIPAGLVPEWEQPADAEALWVRDPMHFPNPLTKVDEILARVIYRTGLSHGFRTYQVPLQADYRRFWTHLYWSVAPLPLPHDEIEAMGKRSEAALGAAMGQLMERWETDWLPEIEAHLAFWEQFNLTEADADTLVAHFDETLQRFERLWHVHFEIVMPSQLAVSLFDEFVRDLFGSEDAFIAYRLVQGFENSIVRTGAELWNLSRKAQASPEVRSVVEQQPATSVISSLESTDEGRAFLRELDDYLRQHGRRGETWGLSYPGWIEDPTPVIQTLQHYLRSDWDPELELAGLAAERDQSRADTRDRLQTYPEPVRQQFEFLLKAAHDGNYLAEEHDHWIDFRAAYEVRCVIMECGRRFAQAGVIADANDVIHLTADEIRATANSLGKQPVDLRSTVEQRKAELAHYAPLEVPPATGTTPPGPPPVNPITVMIAKFFGAPAQPSSDPNILNGAAGSPGVVRGTARVVHALADASRIGVGDILVTTTTAPPWTPLFATVAAVVTDTGGVLSHCAVVAREYRIPAVVGIGTATAVIRDGDEIEVDGDAGTVRIIRRT